MFLKNIMKICLVFIGLGIFSSCVVYAEDSPKWVYRVDSRPPEEVFRNGFSSWGRNDSVYDHVTGRSCTSSLNPSDAFIATTQSENWAVHSYASLYLRDGGNQTMYVYVIRADRNFYSMDTTLDDYSAISSGYARIREHFLPQQEWFTDQPISSQMIYGVRAYTARDIRENRTPEMLYNNYYVDEDTRANSRPYLRIGQTSAVNYTVFELDDTNSTASSGVGACFSPILFCGKNSFKISANDICHLPIKVSEKQLPRQSFSEGASCKIVSFLFYSHLECNGSQVYFYANSGGVGLGLAPVWGRLNFNDSFDQFIDKACTVKSGSIGLYSGITMDCGNGLIATFDGGTAFSLWGIFTGTGYFYKR